MHVYEIQRQPPEVFYKKGYLKISQNSQESTCARVSFFIKVAGFNLKKEILAQVFSSEFFEISKDTFFTEHLLRLLLEIPIKDDLKKHGYRLLIGRGP